ncbi:MAG: D-hexose-6-phosphate mutarotase [Pseudomonadota bacterium]
MNRSTPQVERVELGELACWRVRHAGAELLVAQQGAQVLSYRHDGQPPLIWLSEQAAYGRGQSVRGGVPVCWPWFGDLARNPAAVRDLHPQDVPAPAHGLVRGLDWQLLGIDNTEGRVSLAFACLRPDTDLPGWPVGLELKLTIALDDRLTLDLTSHNRGIHAVTLSQALHSYFAVSDIRQVEVEGLAGSRYRDSLQDWRECSQEGALRFIGETDRLYLDLPPRLSILDRPWQRRITLEASGSRSAVVWNPWIDKARRLSQFDDDAWQGMLCIETANVLDDVRQLAPGQQHKLSVSLATEPL